MPAAKNASQKLLDIAGKFVASRKGAWEHADWEALVAEVQELGFEMDGDESRRNLGNVLEASKHFYLTIPAPPKRKKRAAPRKRAAKR